MRFTLIIGAEAPSEFDPPDLGDWDFAGGSQGTLISESQGGIPATIVEDVDSPSGWALYKEWTTPVTGDSAGRFTPEFPIEPGTIYLRWWVKFPPGTLFDNAGGSGDWIQKVARCYNTSGTLIYTVDIYQNRWFLLFDDEGIAYGSSNDWTSGLGWVGDTVGWQPSDLADGTYHKFETRLTCNVAGERTIQFWIDGTLKFERTTSSDYPSDFASPNTVNQCVIWSNLNPPSHAFTSHHTKYAASTTRIGPD
jgi:hypothetical protein